MCFFNYASSYISKRMVTSNLISLRLLLARVFLTCESFHENSSLNAPSECEEYRSSKQRKYQISSSPHDEKHNCVLFQFQENLSTPEIHFWNLIIERKKHTYNVYCLKEAITVSKASRDPVQTLCYSIHAELICLMSAAPYKQATLSLVQKLNILYESQKYGNNYLMFCEETLDCVICLICICLFYDLNIDSLFFLNSVTSNPSKNKFKIGIFPSVLRLLLSGEGFHNPVSIGI